MFFPPAPQTNHFNSFAPSFFSVVIIGDDIQLWLSYAYILITWYTKKIDRWQFFTLIRRRASERARRHLMEFTHEGENVNWFCQLINPLLHWCEKSLLRWWFPFSRLHLIVDDLFTSTSWNHMRIYCTDRMATSRIGKCRVRGTVDGLITCALPPPCK